MKKNWFSIILLLCTFILIIYTIILNRGRKMEYYDVAEDRIPSVSKVLGERKLSHSSSRKTNSIIYKQYIYSGMDSAIDDVHKYVKFLCREESFHIIQKINSDSAVGTIKLQKKSFVTGKEIQLKIKLENNKYTIFLNRELLFQSSGITVNELKNLLNYEEMNVITLFGNDMKWDSTLDHDSHYIIAKKIGVAFVFSNQSSNSKPDFICINRRINLRKVNYKGAKPGMRFHDIIDKVGKGKVKKTWFPEDQKYIYNLNFKEDGLIYCFISNYKSGTNSELYICLEDKYSGDIK